MFPPKRPFGELTLGELSGRQNDVGELTIGETSLDKASYSPVYHYPE